MFFKQFCRRSRKIFPQSLDNCESVVKTLSGLVEKDESSLLKYKEHVSGNCLVSFPLNWFYLSPHI